VMAQGRIRVTGTPEEVHDRVLETYLHSPRPTPRLEN
jgi:hypothetical protein